VIELSRDITFGQYVNNGSALTRMDPRTKLLGAVFLIVAVSLIGTFTAYALCLLCCILIQSVSRIPVSYVLRSFKPLVIFLVILYVLEVVFYYSPTQHMTLIWHWGIFMISWEGILRSALTILRVLFLYYFASMLMFTTSLVDLTDGSEALLSPLQKIGLPVNELVMVLVIAFKFVPIFVAEAERLMKAQTARGMRFNKGNIFQRVSHLGSLLVPIFLSGFRRAEVLTIAMEARCYRGGSRGWRRTKRRELRFQRYDVLALIVVVVFCVGAIALNFVAAF
jgi:energy-coupling factor transport system permease protein